MVVPNIFSTNKFNVFLNLFAVTKCTFRALFQIPEARSCADAFIEPHWCACLDWQSVPLTSPITARLESTLLTTLNNYTLPQRRLCSELTSKTIQWVNRATPNDNLLKFYKNADIDGFKPDLTGQTAVTSVVYQIKMVAEPGGGIFEASITHWMKEDEMRLRMEDISRINKYGRQASCIEEEFPHLRKYCYCKE